MRLIDLDEFLRQNCVDRMEGKSCDECKHHVLEVSCERLMEQPTAEVTLCHLDSPCEYQNADIAMPSARPERKKGKWISDEDGNIYCSVCGRTGVGESFCEHCGANMKGEEE